MPSLAAALVTAALAQAAPLPQTATDPDTGAQMTIAGAQFSIDLTRAPQLADEIAGAAVQVICLGDLERLAGIEGDIPDTDPAVSLARVTWPAGATSATFTLPRALDPVDLCGMERPGGTDLTWVGISALGRIGRVGIDEAAAHARLRRAAAAAGESPASPAATVARIRRAAPGLTVELVRGLRGVTHAGVVYVLRSRSTSRKVALVTRSPEGRAFFRTVRR